MVLDELPPGELPTREFLPGLFLLVNLYKLKKKKLKFETLSVIKAISVSYSKEVFSFVCLVNYPKAMFRFEKYI